MPPRKEKKSVWDEIDHALSAAVGAEMKMEVAHWLTTGSFMLDQAICGYGLPGGKLCEIYGPFKAAKTFLACRIGAQAQAQGGYVIYLDAEARLSFSLATKLAGLNVHEHFTYRQPDNLEVALKAVYDCCVAAKKSPVPVVVILDSIASLCTKAQSDEGSDIVDGKRVTGSSASKISWFFSQGFLRRIHRSNVYPLFINQTRSKMDFFSRGAPQVTTPGGVAIPYYASTRLELSTEALEKEGRQLGRMVNVYVEKNSFAPPHRTVQIPFLFRQGADDCWALFNYLVSRKLVKKCKAEGDEGEEGRASGQYEFEEQKKTKKKWLAQMKEDQTLLEKFRDLAKEAFEKEF